MDQDLPIAGPRTKAALALLERHRRREAQPPQPLQVQARPMVAKAPANPKRQPREVAVCSTIGEVSHQLGLTQRAIRLYEEMGLIECGRGFKNMRTLSASTKARLKTIVELKQLGLTISEIVALLPDDDAPSPALRARLEARLLDIEQQRDAIIHYLSRQSV